MVQEQKKKYLYVVIAVLLLLVFVPVDTDSVAVSSASPWFTRFTYQFFHANIFHVLLNCWCLLIIDKVRHITAMRMLVCFLVSATIPCFSTVGTVGFSGVCYALMGFLFWTLHRKLFFLVYSFGFIAITALFNTNAVLHAYCLIVSLIIGFFITPRTWSR